MLSALDFWEWRHERRLGIRTAGDISTGDLGFQCRDYNRYMPCGYYEFAQAMRLVRPQPSDVFLDIGSGLGRALILAAGYRYERVIGVELSQELAAQARDNVNRARKRLRCKDVEIIEADVCSFEIPRDVTVIFIYNSVTGGALRQVLEQIHHSFLIAPRPIRIVYHNTSESSAVLGETPWLSKHHEVESIRGRGRDIVIYHVAESRQSCPCT
jgi:SAM-dependent methyltransferase